VLRSHAAGVGPPLPRAVVRSAVAARLNGLLRGHSGIRPLVLERVAALLNAGLVPVVPRTGSLGASGDLAPSAHAFLPLLGEGTIERPSGEVVPADVALTSAGVEPLVLAPKEALALVNGTHFMTAVGALLAVRGARLLDTADAAAALSLEALRGASEAFAARVHELRPLPGQARSAASVRALVAGSERVGAREKEVQDAYSLRCVPQVHGAAREGLRFFTSLVEADLNAVTDNPLVFDEPLEVISAGNFHGQPLALGFDTLRIALADLASISERRTFRLLSPSLNAGLPAFLTPEAGRSSGYMVAQYTAAALTAELRALAHPVSVDTIPTSDNQEDHVSMGMTGALLALDAIDRVETVLAIEVLCAAQALDLVPGRPGTGTVRLHELVRERVAPLVEDRPPADDIEAVRPVVADGLLAAVVRELTDG
jgi:histidine ammonia-lyase